MKAAEEYYRTKLSDSKKELSNVRGRRLTIAWVRGLLFLSIIFLTYHFSQYLSSYWWLLIPAIALFLWLVKKHAILAQETLYLKNLISINDTELEALQGNYSGLEDGIDLRISDHQYCQDIDLFGPGSFYQYINRTKTNGGSNQLANSLLSNDIHDILEKQNEIKELRDKPDFRQSFSAQAMMIKKDMDPQSTIDWFNTQDKTTSDILKYGILIFSALSLLLIIAVAFKLIDSNVLLYQFLLGLLIVASNMKKTNHIANQASTYTDTLKQYSTLIHKIENEELKSTRLLQVKSDIQSHDTKASEILGKLSKIINGFDNRNNLLIAIFLNGFFLYDYHLIYRMKKWMNEHSSSVEAWFEAIYYIDSLNSKAGYAYNNPDYVFPKIVDESNTQIISAVQLGHPLIDRKKRVDNDITIDKGEFMIITGANMAGKSTFLRTIALHIVSSNTGLPAAAKDMSYRPIKLISSMRTSDSLKDDESYFFSELKRLKYIVDLIQSDEYFIILDEILKGTNSKDKEEGSKKFVQKLISTSATGIIATHDLSLCTLSNEHEEVINRYFDAEIIDDELFFDYTFKDGVCQNMNASFLLKKMGIV